MCIGMDKRFFVDHHTHVPLQKTRSALWSAPDRRRQIRLHIAVTRAFSPTSSQRGRNEPEQSIPNVEFHPKIGNTKVHLCDGCRVFKRSIHRSEVRIGINPTLVSKNLRRSSVTFTRAPKAVEHAVRFEVFVLIGPCRQCSDKMALVLNITK